MTRLDISRHVLVSTHILLTKEEAEKVMKELGVTPDDLPKITTRDPMVKYLKAKRGDLIKLVRNSPTAGQSVSYRVVV
ncbi:MAG TPA: DNA-directed RNA polymerase subunit H [Thermoprotei archaeon]|nr:DNA-directed RNA polymerase subunit H [TACK group archaeon]HEV51580.1 DNA-directed RNA polymerase subunit H [Thermoprotei archaeon]